VQSSQAGSAFEGFNSTVDKMVKSSNHQSSSNLSGTDGKHKMDRKHFHVSDALLQHYESALRTKTKPR
jgi:hypothetical protein